MAFELKMRPVTAEELKRKGGRSASRPYLQFLNDFLASKVKDEESGKMIPTPQIHVEGAPTETKELNKLVVNLKKTRTENNLPIKVVIRDGQLFIARQ